MGKNVFGSVPFAHRRQRVPRMRAWLEATPMYIVWSIVCGLDSCISRQNGFNSNEIQKISQGISEKFGT